MGHRRDLTGQEFGEWKVLYPVDGGKWHCKCSCGTEKDILTGKLTSGQTFQCGHNKLKDMTGQKFGDWEVLKYAGDMKWLCKCSCGVEREVLGKHLRNGRQTSCGHAGSPRRIDLTGQKFGDLTVLKYAEDKYWLCQCSCGRIKEIHGTRLRNGWVTSCGHRSGFKDLANKRFGKLVPIKYLHGGYYECQCDCGNKRTVYAGNLRNGSTISCGCAVKAITKEDILEVINDYTEHYKEQPTKVEVAQLIGISLAYLSKLQSTFEINSLYQTKFRSRQEKEIYDIIKQFGYDDRDIEVSNHKILGNRMEIDIYIPQKKLGIEFNGTYWHSSELKPDKEYHQKKQLQCESKGIRLIHIFEYEWDNESTREKIINLLRYELTPSNKIYARNCIVKSINGQTANEFIEKYHLQNTASSSINYGLYNGEQLISVMTFGYNRFNQDAEYELIRYVSKPGTVVIGGASKMFKTFIKEFKPSSIIQYCDISKFQGKLYENIGMQLDKITEQSYVWVIGQRENMQVYSRYQCQKQKLIDMGLSEYGDTADEIMENLGYTKIYTCGNKRYIWKN